MQAPTRFVTKHYSDAGGLLFVRLCVASAHMLVCLVTLLLSEEGGNALWNTWVVEDAMVSLSYAQFKSYHDVMFGSGPAGAGDHFTCGCTHLRLAES